MKYNIGCGTTHISGAINVDCEESVKPDLCFDIRKEWPIESETADEIYFFHTIEHIEKRFHKWILSEMHRILKPDGRVVISYPEFSKIAEHWIKNSYGMREFFEATIYGRQIHKSDYHVALMDSVEFTTLMRERGFDGIVVKPEPNDNWNTVVVAKKGVPYIYYEELVYNEIWGQPA